MNTLEENAIKEMMNMSEDEINTLAANHLANLTPSQMSLLRDRAENFAGTKTAKEAVNKLQKKGVTRKKMMKQIKEAKKNAPKTIDDSNLLNAILINESRKIKQISCHEKNLETEIKKILKCKDLSDLAEFVCFQISVGPLSEKYVSVYFDSSKSCEVVGNKRIDRITGVHNSGAAVFVCKDGGLGMDEFLEAEKVLLSIR